MQNDPQPTGARTLRNTGLIVAAQTISQLLTLLVVMIMNRHLTPSQFGIYGLVVTTSALVTVLIDVGFNTLFQRQAARHPTEISRYLSNLVSARVLFAIPAMITFAVVLQLNGKVSYLAAGFSMMLFTSYSQLLRNSLYVAQRLSYEVVAIIGESIFLLIAAAVGALHQVGPGYYLWAYSVRAGLDCIYFLVVLHLTRIARIGWRFEPQLIVEWFWQGLPLALTFIITGIYFNVDILFLSFLRGSAETGLYTSAYKPFQALLFLPQGMFSVIFPVMAKMYRQEKKSLLPPPQPLPARGRESDEREGVVKAIFHFAKVLGLLGWPITVGTFMLAPGFRFIYNYPGSEPALRILSLAIIFMFLSNAFIVALNAINRQSSFTWVAFWSMVVNLTLNLLLIPTFGYLGAAVATVLTEVALGIFGWQLTARHLVRLPVWRLTWKALLASLLMGIALIPFRDVGGLLLLPVIVGGGMVYILGLLLLRTLDQEEWEIFRQALRLK